MCYNRAVRGSVDLKVSGKIFAAEIMILLSCFLHHNVL